MRTVLLVLSWCSALWWLTLEVSAVTHLTTRSPLTAFKQLGFNYGGNVGVGQQAPYIPYSISTFHDPETGNGLEEKVNSNSKGRSERFQQIRHPNDILSNMGVDLPSEELLGRNLLKTSKAIEMLCKRLHYKK